MAQYATQQDIQKAHGGEVTDRLLQTLQEQSRRAHYDAITEEGAALVLLCLPSLIDELLAHRARANDGLSLDLPENVVRLPNGRDRHDA